ncbi:hypothetical protein UPM260_4052 [Salmonella enterica subsp. enterica serovar Typhimurium]|nr:hypothetical protein SNSL317_A1540 [Salmonella enterica subsp. enterica serovar Newport str. SL317]CDF56479.1 hypothetical protein BN855_42980 [Salmonella enterica subsp. enterica serovar Bovismorbificans str. 3114]VUG02252.1 hypothetical protein UPM260_4052 [Salmonella enterica subsp. enterica serovar Typhimurium]
MRAGAHKNTPIFAGGITKFLFCSRPWSQALCPHPPASSPIKKPGVEDLPQSGIAHSQAIMNVAVNDRL